MSSPPEIPGKETFRVLGRRSAAGPLRIRSGNPGQEQLMEAVPQALQVRRGAGEALPGQAAGCPQGYQIRHVFGAGPAAPFLGGPVEQRGKGGAAPHVQGPDAFGGVELVPRHREKIHLQFLHVHGDLAHALGRVGVKGHSRLPGQGADLRDGLQGAGFVVGVHDADQDGVRGQGPAHVIRVHPAGAVHGQDGKAKPLGLEIPAGGQHRRMLRGTGDDAPAADDGRPLP